MTNNLKTNQIFIFIHDQELLLEFEKNKKFKNLTNYSYIFVGSKDNSKIRNMSNVLIAKDFTTNLENYPLFTAFTGWYMLWKNNLITKDYVTLLEYDVILQDSFEDSLSEIILNNYDLIGYIPQRMDTYQYIDNPSWVQKIIPAIKKIHDVDIPSVIKSVLNLNPNALWSATNNVTFKKDTFEEYMKWFEPLIDEIKEDKYCGHAQERAYSFFYTIKNKNVAITNGLLRHFQLNSHGTQTHNVNYEVSHKKLINNQI